MVVPHERPNPHAHLINRNDDSAMPRRKRNGIPTGPLVAPSVAALFVWMAVPLGMTVYFSLIYFNLLNPDQRGYVGLANYTFLLEDPAFWTSIGISTWTGPGRPVTASWNARRSVRGSWATSWTWNVAFVTGSITLGKSPGRLRSISWRIP